MPPKHWVELLAEHDRHQLGAAVLAADPHCTVLWGPHPFARSSLPPNMSHEVVEARPADSLDTCYARSRGASGAQFHHLTGLCTVFELHS
jgi:hypothetical protein